MSSDARSVVRVSSGSARFAGERSGSRRGRRAWLALATAAAAASPVAIGGSPARGGSITFAPTNSTSETNAPGSGVYTYPYSGPLTVYRWDVGTTVNWSGDSTVFTAGDTVTFNQASGTFNIASDATLAAGPAASMTFDGGADYVFQRASTSSPGSIGFTGGTAGTVFDTYSSGSPFGAGLDTDVTLSSTYTGRVVLRARADSTSTGTVTINGGTLEINDQNAMPGGNTPVVVLGGGTLAININTGNPETVEGNRNPASSGLNNNDTPLSVASTSTLANTAVDMDGVTPRFQNTMYNGAINIANGATLNVGLGGGTVIGGNLSGSAVGSTLSLGNQSTFLRVSQVSGGGGANTVYDLGNGSANLEGSGVTGTYGLGSLVGGNNTALRGSTSTGATSMTYSIGALNQNASYGGRIMNGVGTTGGGNTPNATLVGHTNLTKVGTGNLTLSGTNHYSGTTTVNAGTVTAGSAHAFGDSASNVTVNAGATLNLDGQSQEAGKHFVLAGGSLVNNGAAAATVGSGASGHVNAGASGAIEGQGVDPSVTVSGGGGSGATADVLMQVGWLRANAGTTGTSVGSGYTKSPIITFDPAPAGGRTAQAFATISPTNGTVTGITVVDSGWGYTSVPGFTITNAPGDTTGSGFSPRLSMSVSTILFGDGGTGYTSAPDVTINIPGAAAGSVAPSTALGTLTAGFGRITVNSNSNIGGSGALNVAAPISGAGGLTKVGTGTTTFSNANTYAGSTTVSEGTLALAGGSLGNGNVTVQSGAAFSMNGASALTFNVDGEGAGQFDVLTQAAGGTVALDGTLNVDFGAAFALGGSWDLFALASGSADGFDALNLTGSYTGSLTEATAGLWTGSVGGQDWSFAESTGVLSASAVPEPAGLALLALGAVPLLHRRRRAAGRA